MKKVSLLFILLFVSFSLCSKVEAKEIYTCRAIICSQLEQSDCKSNGACTWKSTPKTCIAKTNKKNNVGVDTCTSSEGTIVENYCYRYNQTTCNDWETVNKKTVTSEASEYTPGTTQMDTYTYGAGDSCPILGNPETAGDLAYYLQTGLNIMKYAGLILVLILTVQDIIKGLTEDNKDFSKNLVKLFIQRMIYAILLFFLPTIVNVILQLLELSGTCGIE